MTECREGTDIEEAPGLRRSVLQLNADELTSAWSSVDPLRVAYDRFAERNTERDTERRGRLLPHPATPDLLLLEDFRAGRRAVLPAARSPR